MKNYPDGGFGLRLRNERGKSQYEALQGKSDDYFRYLL